MPNRFSLADIDRRKAIVRDVLGPIAQAKRDSTIATFYKRVMPSDQGRIHTSLAPDTASGRLSSSESALFRHCSSNLQNQPKKIARLDPLYHVRDLFVPSPGMILVAGDYAGAEAVLVAAYMQDWPFYDKLLLGLDVHAEHGRDAYGADYDDPAKTELLRQIVKSVTYASFYYASVPILQRTVNKDVEHLNLYLSQAQVAAVRTVILQRHPIERWWEETRRLLERHAGILRNCFGYSRTFRAPDPHKRLKEALSFFPQSTVAWLMNDALPLLYDHLDRPGECELLLQIHDEALFQCRPECVTHLVQQATPILQREFIIHDHPVHIPVEWSSGPDWGHLQKLKVA